MATDSERNGPTAADAIADSDDLLPPGHPAASTPPIPSAGEQISRGADELAVPGDDIVHENTDHSDYT